MFGDLDNEDRKMLHDAVNDSEILLHEKTEYHDLYEYTFEVEKDTRRMLQNGTITEEEYKERLKDLQKRRELYSERQCDVNSQRLEKVSDFGVAMKRRGEKKGLLYGAIGGVVGGIAGTVAFALVKDTLKEALGKLLK